MYLDLHIYIENFIYCQTIAIIQSSSNGSKTNSARLHTASSPQITYPNKEGGEYIYIYIHMHTHIYIHTYIHTYKHIYIYNGHTYAHTYIY